MSWERLSRHKSAGGMEFRDFRDFNLTMLGKQGWMFMSNPNSLATQVYKARYFPKYQLWKLRSAITPVSYGGALWRRKMLWRNVFDGELAHVKRLVSLARHGC